jgi:4-hydroxybenzoate polyprenyltransferase
MPIIDSPARRISTAVAIDAAAARPAVRPRTRVPRDLLQLIRPGQWAKNIVVVPIVLLDAPWRVTTIAWVGWAVAVFILASCLTYIVNDLTDVRRDRLHPVKRDRPLAAGRISVRLAIALAVTVAAALVALAALARPVTLWPVLTYLALNAAYSAALKHVPLVDIFVVAGGFVLRVAFGYVVLGLSCPGWLIVSVFSLCLLLSLGKRRHELSSGGVEHRPALRGYTVAFADQLLVLTASITAVAFLLYLRDESTITRFGGIAVIVSAPFALFALFRYLQGLHIRQTGGDPVRALLRDRALVVTTLLWLVGLGVIMMVARFGGGA